MPAEDRVARVTAVGAFRESPDKSFTSKATFAYADTSKATRFFVVKQNRVNEGNERIFFENNGANRGLNVTLFAEGTNLLRFNLSGSGGNSQADLPWTPSERQGPLLRVIGWSYDDVNGSIAREPGTTVTAAANGTIVQPNSVATIGRRLTAGAVTSMSIVAIAGEDGVALDATDLQSRIDDIKNDLKHGRRLDTTLSGLGSHYLDARDIDFVGAEWIDQGPVGGYDFDMNGNPELLSHPARFA